MTRVLNRYWLWTLVIAAALIFIFVQSGFDFEYVIPKRLNRLGAIVIGGVCVAVSSIVFQTIAGNRILTPAVMGYEAVYLLLQSLLTLVLGGHGLIAIGRNESFSSLSSSCWPTRGPSIATFSRMAGATCTSCCCWAWC